VLLPALRYAENGTFTVNFWQRVHRRFPDSSQYMFSHQALPPVNVNVTMWDANQVQQPCAVAAYPLVQAVRTVPAASMRSTVSPVSD
jgi:hypothetical protein